MEETILLEEKTVKDWLVRLVKFKLYDKEPYELQLIQNDRVKYYERFDSVRQGTDYFDSIDDKVLIHGWISNKRVSYSLDEVIEIRNNGKVVSGYEHNEFYFSYAENAFYCPETRAYRLEKYQGKNDDILTISVSVLENDLM